MSGDGPASAPVFKRRKKRGNVRKRVAVEEEDTEAGPAVVKKARDANGSAITASSSSGRRAATFAYKSEKGMLHGAGAIKDSVVRSRPELEAPVATDAQAATDALREETQDGKLYKGQRAYKNYGASKDRKGPVRATGSIRSVTQYDYQPAVCKDFKETGYCGYGQNCLFLHDRSDYKAGWQMDKEWEEEQERQKRLARGEELTDDEDSDSDDELPWACHICRKVFTNPVETKCGHYFCEACALARFRKTSRCAICGEDTRGTFKTARKIIKRLADMKAKGMQPPVPSTDEDESDAE